jgi:hypothetical protein
MRKTIFAIAAVTALMVGLGGWAVASMPHGRVVPSTGLQIDAIQATIDARTLPAQHFDDYSLVF